MALRDELRRLRQSAVGVLESFELEDGSKYYFDPASGELFLFGCECVRVQGTGKPYPETPEIIKALTRAKERRAALEKVPVGGLSPFERDALVERGELVRRSLVYGQTLDDPGNLSEF